MKEVGGTSKGGSVLGTALTDLLRNVDHFAGLDDEVLALFEASMEVADYPEDSVICREGDAGDWMFVVGQGEVEVVKDDGEGGAIQVALLEPGQFGGMMSLFERRPRSATLRARTPVRLHILKHTAFQSLLAGNVEVAMAMLAYMSHGMRQDTHNLAMTLRYVKAGGLEDLYEACSPDERLVLDMLNLKVAAAESLEDVLRFVYDSLRKIGPCDRLSVAFLSDDEKRVEMQCAITNGGAHYLTDGYARDLSSVSLGAVLESGQPRIINDLEAHLALNPDSEPTRLLVREGMKSSMTCPLKVEDRPVGFLFRNARVRNAFDGHQRKLHLAIAERLSQAVEKAYRIEQLTAANRAYFEVLGFVTHELKSPLSSIVMNAEVLLGGYLGEMSPEQAGKVEGIVAKSNHLLELIGEYLSLSQIESGALDPNFQEDVPFIADVVAMAVDLVLPQAERKGVAITRDYGGDEFRVRCAPDLMRIVVTNLLSNAVKYGHENGEIRLTVRETGGMLRMQVWNTGPGFPEAAQASLFRKFSRIQTPELLKERGTGVGLYTTWRIIQAHGGAITAQSQEGEWAEFSFQIPLAAEA